MKHLWTFKNKKTGEIYEDMFGVLVYLSRSEARAAKRQLPEKEEVTVAKLVVAPNTDRS